MIAIISAAGLSKRMKSPKFFIIILKPILVFSLRTALAFAEHIYIVVNPTYQYDVRYLLLTEFTEDFHKFTFVVQTNALGTGDAIMRCVPYLSAYPEDTQVLLLPADVPFIHNDTIQLMIQTLETSKFNNAILTHIKENPFGCGRIITNDKEQVLQIIEEKDCTDEERENKCINCGIYICTVETMMLAKQINNNNAAREYYLTDLVELAYDDGLPFKSVELPAEKWYEFVNINTPQDVKDAKHIYKTYINPDCGELSDEIELAIDISKYEKIEK